MAEKWADETEARILLSPKLIPGRTFVDACERYVEEVAVNHKGQRWDVIRLKRFCVEEDIAQVFLTKLTFRHFDQWVDERK